MAVPRTPMRTKGSGRVFAAVALAVFSMQMLGDMSFAVPKTQAATATRSGMIIDSEAALSSPQFVNGARSRVVETERVQMQASVLTGIGPRILNAMGAGAVASVIQAALSAVGEPIINRVLVKRMKLMEALKDVTPAMMLDFFKTTLMTNFLKFPFFEAINAVMSVLPVPAAVRGLVTGLVFTSATLPVTNYRYRKSMQLEVNWGNLYEAYGPTVIRDVAYGIIRNYATVWAVGLSEMWTRTSPQVLFIVVLIGCFGSAPFNEWRGFLLQSKGQEMSFSEFFKPANFIRSTSLGAVKQALSLAAGYWATPPASKFVAGLIASIRGA